MDEGATRLALTFFGGDVSEAFNMHYGRRDYMMNKLCNNYRYERIIDGESAITAIDSYTLACLRGATGNQDAFCYY